MNRIVGKPVKVSRMHGPREDFDRSQVLLGPCSGRFRSGADYWAECEFQRGFQAWQQRDDAKAEKLFRSAARWRAQAERIDASKRKLHDQIAADKYEPLELNCLNWIMPRVPRGAMDREELGAQIRFYCIEAVDLFDPSRGVPFASFIKLHVRQRTQALRQKLWIRYDVCKMVRFSQTNSNTDRARSPYGDDEDGRNKVLSVADPHDTINDDPAVNARVREFRESISCAAQAALDTLLACPNQDKLCSSFRSRQHRSRVYEMSGLTPEQVAPLVAEVRAKLGKYV
jgi:hypothetical protein